MDLLFMIALKSEGKPIQGQLLKLALSALFPLLFCTGLNPLSQIIAKSAFGYQFRKGTSISPLLYIDDINLYAKGEQDIGSTILVTRIYCNDISMSFWLNKCSWMIQKGGKMIIAERI